MSSQRSAGLIVFRFEGEPKIILLEYGRGLWGFPKGNIEPGESEEEAAIRETKEETGLTDLKIIDNFKELIQYYFRDAGNIIHKEVIYFLAETKETEITISYEHYGYEWLTYNEALKRLIHKNDKNILWKANKAIFDLSSRKV